MKPPYEITSSVLGLISSISMKLGEVKANFLSKPSSQLREQNKIKTIHSSLSIERNTLSQEQMTAILENKILMSKLLEAPGKYRSEDVGIIHGTTLADYNSYE